MLTGAASQAELASVLCAAQFEAAMAVVGASPRQVTAAFKAVVTTTTGELSGVPACFVVRMLEQRSEWLAARGLHAEALMDLAEGTALNPDNVDMAVR